MSAGQERRLPRRVRPDAWHVDDVAAWQAARKSGDVLDEAGRAAGWAPPTAQKIEHAVGYFLGWCLDEAGASVSSIPDLAAPERLVAYVAWLQPRLSPVTVLGLIVDLSEYIRVACPDHARTVIKRIETRLRWKAVPTKDKRSRLVTSAELFRVGEELMLDMDDVPFDDPRLPLARYRDGLAICLLASRPLRIRAFASLELRKHIRLEGGVWRIDVPAELMKTRRPWEATVPEASAAALAHYLDYIRPALLRLRGRWHRPAGDALWISIDGSPMRPKALGEAIAKRTQEALGHAIYPHLFRDSAATTLALESPEQVKLAAPLLGHSDPRTTERHYNQAKSVDAGRRLLQAMRSSRGKSSGAARGRRAPDQAVD
jgi:integrase/recombinase XerD